MDTTEDRVAAPAPAPDAPVVEEAVLVEKAVLVEEAVLVEDLSIDGMCGVY